MFIKLLKNWIKEEHILQNYPIFPTVVDFALEMYIAKYNDQFGSYTFIIEINQYDTNFLTFTPPARKKAVRRLQIGVLQSKHPQAQLRAVPLHLLARTQRQLLGLQAHLGTNTINNFFDRKQKQDYLQLDFHAWMELTSRWIVWLQCEYVSKVHLQCDQILELKGSQIFPPEVAQK